ncbi:hypothetical protein BH20ACI1_BH20ACI1_24380 [soil metagenome]
MKVLFILIILFSYSCVWAQEKELKLELPVHHRFDDERNLSEYNQAEEPDMLAESSAEEEFRKLHKPVIFAAEPARKRQRLTFLAVETENEQAVEKIEINEKGLEKNFRQFNFPKKKFDDSTRKIEEKFHWKPSLIQSGLFLGIQHGFRLFQRKTQRELDGPFFRDWGKSVKSLRGWADGDNTFINYVGHPMQGAATGRIFINNSDKSKKLEFGRSKDYWTSRMKAMAWSAVWSTQFEIGPISEANIGNVGLNNSDGRNGMAWVDLIMTPVAGTGVLIGEDMIDRYILKNWLEKKLTSRTRIKVYRTFFNPLTSFVNVLGGKKPWKRYNR